MLLRKIAETHTNPETLIADVKLAMNNPKKIFDSNKFCSILTCGRRSGSCGWRNSVSGLNSNHATKISKYNEILSAVNHSGSNVKFDNNDFLVSLSRTAKDLQTELTSIHIKSREMPYDLYEKMSEAINSLNFDLKSVFKKYYTKLNTCHNIEEVLNNYPHFASILGYQKNLHLDTKNFLGIYDNITYDSVVLQAIKKGYLNLIPKESMYILLPNKTIKSAVALDIAGIRLPIPTTPLLKFLEKAENFWSKFASIPNLTKEEKLSLAKMYALEWIFINLRNGTIGCL